MIKGGEPMRSLRVWPAVLLALMSIPSGSWSVGAAAAAPQLSCGSLTLYLHPGFNPPLGNNPIRVAPDAPHGSFPVSLPVYPGASRLIRLLDTPYGASQGDALYMQTAAAEYRSAAAATTVLKWYQ